MKNYIVKVGKLPKARLWKASKTPTTRWRVRYTQYLQDGTVRIRVIYGGTEHGVNVRAEAEHASITKIDPKSRLAKKVKSYDQLELFYRQLYSRCKRNAHSRYIDFELSEEDVVKLFNRSRGLCEFSKAPFNLDMHGSHGRKPFAPSIDRINNSEGYSLKNCRLICVFLNYAFSTWGELPLQTVLRYMKEHYIAEMIHRSDEQMDMYPHL